ncbi:hypothetical protein AVI53_00200 [Piscirickettsia salmonis]|uniref:IS3 family transposase n=1 Tax=Piscirickettsia salmonis TaxID=1238 RepID=UPI0003777AFF|nr:IS3 family transposase [Piscirickettsia salmonis]ALT18314.1 hypothetical protein PSLF89_05260 [Piscirickettsia salmonis LF-89 = ATCC VR-1361]ALY02472.1 hypothetical protein AWE47_06075 [Piscirickettsia salmonis]AMA41991.1 hypothetical protein AWJ11_06100 [Piscirickettsia salmonis]AOS34463.1 hypothetical protein AVM72_03275 [Piscirickettsia salmonis]APS59183.1 hypothetical protein AVI53_00200 [Piscirickettsia salmonis]
MLGDFASLDVQNTYRGSDAYEIYDYLLDDLYIARPNHAWQVDITYIHTRKGFAYLTALIDVYSRYIVGWVLSNTMEASFCLEALNQALELRL